MKALVDNDVLLKGACYGLLNEFAAAIPGDEPFGVLGAARFVITKRLRKMPLRGSAPAAQQRVLDFLALHQELEPTLDEQSLAARLEMAAQRLLLNLDAGESQLAAILVVRTVSFLLTGDKRAIIALERMLESDSTLGGVIGKVICIERLMQMLLLNLDENMLRAGVCAEPEVDRAISICFSCSTCSSSVVINQGLTSYITDLRRSAPTVLAT